MKSSFNIISIILTIFVHCTNGLSWMVSNVLLASSTMQLNQADLALTKSVSAGAYTAIAECSQQFKYETWSCPEQAFYLNDARRQQQQDNERNNNALVLDENKKNNNRKVFKSSRSLKFKALKRKGSNNNNKRQRNRNADKIDDDEIDSNVNNSNNNRDNKRDNSNNRDIKNFNRENSNNNFNRDINNQIKRRKARTRTAKLSHDIDNDANNNNIALIDATENLFQRLPDWKGVQRPTTRETAFVHAIMSAGITHTLTKNCSSGDFPDCVCDNRLTRKQLGWEWGGCSDNFHFGSQVAKQFLDTVESGADSQSLANLHNNEAGRIAVRKTMRRLCKCHGVSGSCATQTCWRQISDFREVGNHLKEMYHSAMKVDYDNGFLDRSDNSLSNRIGRTARGSNTPIDRFRRKSSSKLMKRNLVFIEDSPDYCRKNATAGYPGVIGRTCSTEPGNPKSKVSVETCTELCERCGLKIRRRVVEEMTSCNCRFKWCCSVTCETCLTKRIEMTCVP